MGRSAIQSNVNSLIGFEFLFNGSLVDKLTVCNCYDTRYGSYPVRGKYCHEMALRILLASIEVYI